MVFLLFLLDNGRIRTREAQNKKLSDPDPDPDPDSKHCKKVRILYSQIRKSRAVDLDPTFLLRIVEVNRLPMCSPVTNLVRQLCQNTSYYIYCLFGRNR
jgi:hypothetical protein